MFKKSSAIKLTGLFFLLMSGSALANSNEALLEIIKTLETTYQARAFGVEAEKYKGYDVYEIETLRNGQFYETYIDPQSGQIIADEKEDTVFWKPLDDEEKKALLNSKISLSKALVKVSDKNKLPIQQIVFKVKNEEGYFKITFEGGSEYLISTNFGHADEN